MRVRATTVFTFRYKRVHIASATNRTAPSERKMVMEIHHFFDLYGDRRVDVGEWDWEAYEAHKHGQTELSQSDLMSLLKNQTHVDRVQAEAREDAASNARRMCVVVDGFMPEAECNLLTSQLNPILRSTKSSSLHNLVLNSSTADFAECTEQKTIKLLASIAERMWDRLNALSETEAGCALLKELRTAPEWSSRDYHVRHLAKGGEPEKMEMRLRAMSDHVRVMRYSAPVEEAQTGEAPKYDGDGGFPTDPRNAHHDGRNRRPAGDSFVTALLYLNGEGEGVGEGEPLEGGHTLFLDGGGQPVARVAPRKGSLLLFDHHLYHRGERVLRGDKLCLRSDLLYLPSDTRTGEPMMDLVS